MSYYSVCYIYIYMFTCSFSIPPPCNSLTGNVDRKEVNRVAWLPSNSVMSFFFFFNLHSKKGNDSRANRRTTLMWHKRTRRVWKYGSVQLKTIPYEPYASPACRLLCAYLTFNLYVTSSNCNWDSNLQERVKCTTCRWWIWVSTAWKCQTSRWEMLIFEDIWL